MWYVLLCLVFDLFLKQIRISAFFKMRHLTGHMSTQGLTALCADTPLCKWCFHFGGAFRRVCKRRVQDPQISNPNQRWGTLQINMQLIFFGSLRGASSKNGNLQEGRLFLV